MSLTAAGGQRLADVEAALTAAEDDVLSALAPAQRQTLHDLLHRANTGHVVTCTVEDGGAAETSP